jgi:hypothetical protein
MFSVTKILLKVTITLFFTISLQAEYPVEVRKAASEGRHFDALTIYNKIPSRIIDSQTSFTAAESAWALGLNQEALDLFDATIYRSRNNPELLIQSFIGQAVIQFQESRYQESIRTISRINKLPLIKKYRGHVALLTAHIKRIFNKDYKNAINQYLIAINSLNNTLCNEAKLWAGRLLVKTGNYFDAKKIFTEIPMNAIEGKETLIELIKLGLIEEDYKNVKLLIERGKEEFSELKNDSYIDYSLVKATVLKNASKRGDSEKIGKIIASMKENYSPSDAWLALAEAEVEIKYYSLKNRNS